MNIFSINILARKNSYVKKILYVIHLIVRRARMSLVLIDSGTTYLKLVTVDNNNRIVDKKEYSTYDTEEMLIYT